MDRKAEDGAVFWNKRSEVYDSQVIPVYKTAYQKTVTRSLKFLNPQDKVLEIGCGTGNATIPLSGYVKEITALDISGAMMKKAMEKAEELGKENIKFREMEVLDLKAQPGSFDAVTAYNVLLYMKDREQVLDKIYELLKPGGIFISATDCLGRNLSKDAVRKFVKSHLHLMPYVAFETPISLMRKIQKHGFLVLEIVNLYKNPPNIFIVAQKIEKNQER